MVLDPRFSGGTSTSAAADIRALAPHVRLSVVAIETAMFKGRRVHPAIEEALDEPLLERHRGVEEDDREASRDGEDGLDDGLSKLVVEVV